jgi:hypothetical protein
MAGVDAKPTRVIAGQTTKLSRTMHDVRYDAVHDELIVTNPFANAILVFRGGATGEEPPIRIIQGPHTQLRGNTDRLEVDPVNNEIYIPLSNAILVFPREGNGDVAPVRVIKGPDTKLKSAGSLAVDPVNNVIAVGLSGGEGEGATTENVLAESSGTKQGEPAGMQYGQRGQGGILFFNRTDNGNVKPIGGITGPKTGIVRILQLQMYPPKGELIATQPGRPDREEPEGIYVGVWSIHDNGDVPPRWKLAGPKSTLKKPRGVVLDPKHKEMIIADMRLNSILTYYFPEIF